MLMAVIQGGLQLSSGEDGDVGNEHLDSGTPGVRGGLRTLKNDLFGRNEKPDIFALPQIYWNQMGVEPWDLAFAEEESAQEEVTPGEATPGPAGRGNGHQSTMYAALMSYMLQAARAA